MNLNGVTGDSRKRLEALIYPTFDRHPECVLCGRCDVHTHAPDLNYPPISAIVSIVPEQ